MEILPSREIMRKNGVFNKISKIYWSADKDIIFNSITEAKDYFLSQQAQDLFCYCCEEQYRLTENKKGLHWTIGFGEPDNQTPGMIKWADIWRESKEKLREKWWNNMPIIEHNAPELF